MATAFEEEIKNLAPVSNEAVAAPKKSLNLTLIAAPGVESISITPSISTAWLAPEEIKDDCFNKEPFKYIPILDWFVKFVTSILPDIL